jgi:hypothetical protein
MIDLGNIGNLRYGDESEATSEDMVTVVSLQFHQTSYALHLKFHMNFVMVMIDIGNLRYGIRGNF